MTRLQVAACALIVVNIAMTGMALVSWAQWLLGVLP